jgi:carboxyl-terminal processing protease
MAACTCHLRRAGPYHLRFIARYSLQEFPVRSKKIIAPVLLGIVAAALLVQLPVAIAQRAGDYDFFDTMIDIRHILQENFADKDKVDDSKMKQAAIDGMLDVLDDPHTVYVPPADKADFDKDLRGTYVGIGCEVNFIDHYLTIISPMDGSPALAAGVMAGDIVLEIEGQSTYDKPVEECIDMLMGEPGTPVTIKVRHLDGQEELLTITRGRIVTRTVRGLFRAGEEWRYCIDGALGLSYIKLTQFNEDSFNELLKALDGAKENGLNGLILDLRDNPGGSLEMAWRISDLFLEEGTIVSVRPRKGEEQSLTARHEGTLPPFPMLVLVNGQSASASEIVSGALQHNGRAKVLGTRTFGKGSVQEVRELDYNRGTLKFTTALYYLGNGRSINRSSDSEVWGVDPDPGMVVAVTDEDYIAMLRARRDFDVIKAARPDTPDCGEPKWIRDNLKDEQLARAVEALQTRLTRGEWPEVGESDAADAAFELELHRATEARARLLEQLSNVEETIDKLHGLAEKVGKPPLLPEDIDLLQGTLTVKDKLGNVVATYRIEGGNLELALDTMQLTPVP